MKTNAIIRIILFSLAIVVLLGILLFGVGFKVMNAHFRPRLNRSETPEPTSGQMGHLEFPTDIKRIEIEWVAGDIMIDAREGLNTISVFESMGNDVTETLFCTTSGDTLKIQFSEASLKFPSFGINYNFSKDLHIVVPATWHCDELTIDAAASNVTINALTINDMDFEGASGQLGFYGCNVFNLDIDTVSGDIEFDGALENLDFDAASANFYGTIHNCPTQLQMDSLSGKLNLSLPSDCGFTLNRDSLSGSFSSDFEIMIQGDARVHGDGSCKIALNGLSGDVNINKFQTESGTDCNDPNCSDASHNHSQAKTHHQEQNHH